MFVKKEEKKMFHVVLKLFQYAKKVDGALAKVGFGFYVRVFLSRLLFMKNGYLVVWLEEWKVLRYIHRFSEEVRKILVSLCTYNSEITRIGFQMFFFF